MTDAELERQLRALGPVEPPRALQIRVLAEVGVAEATIAAMVGPAPAAESAVSEGPSASWGGGGTPPQRPPRDARPSRSARPSRYFWPAAVGALALAAAILLAVRVSPPDHADPDALVPRGSGEVLPSLGLRVAVRSGGQVERLAVGKAYSAGDTLLFRVSASAPMDIVLRRGEVILYRGNIPAGDTDLPIGYALEAGEAAARFVVEGGGAQASAELPEVRR